MRKTIAVALTLWLSHPAFAAAPEAISTDWSGMRQQFNGKKYEGTHFQIRTTDGRSFRADLIRIDDEAFVVKVRRATQQWVDGREAKIPRTIVAAVRSTRKHGHRGLIGGSAGLAAGFGAGAAAVSGDPEVTGRGMGILLVSAVGGAIAGYLLGHATDSPEPEYRLHQ